MGIKQEEFFLFLVLFSVAMCLIYGFCKYALRDVIEQAEILPSRIKRASRRLSRSLQHETSYHYPRRKMRILLYGKRELNLSIEAKNNIFAFLPPPEFCLWAAEKSGHLLRSSNRDQELYHIRADGSKFSTGSQNGIAKCPIPSKGVHIWEVRYDAKIGQLRGGNCVGVFCGNPPPRRMFLSSDLCDDATHFFGIHETLFLEEEESKDNDSARLYDSGDVVRVTLDRSKRAMSFSCNGKPLNVKIENVPSSSLYIVCSPYMRETSVRLKHIRSEF